MIASLAATWILLTGAAEPSDEFQFYLDEVVNCEMNSSDPFVSMVLDRLVDATFAVGDSDVFYRQLELMKNKAHEYPLKRDRFMRLDRKLYDRFQLIISAAKQKRLWWSIGGTVAGAIVGIPIGKLISGAAGAKAFWIAVPVGALAGGGVGYLLGELLAMPHYRYESGTLSNDLQNAWEELEK